MPKENPYKNENLQKSIEGYLAGGCGRCKFHDTPQCKINTWREVLLAVRSIVLETELKEEMKWGFPVYTLKGKNLIMVSAFKEYVAFTFWNGVLLNDEAKLLEKQGENVQASRLIKFTDLDQVDQLEDTIRAYLQEAIELEKSGAKYEAPDPAEREIPEELQAALDRDPELTAAFFALTPGRQRSYLIYVSGAKQAATRESRVENAIPKIFAGKGWLER